MRKSSQTAMRPRRELLVAWALLWIFLHIGEAQNVENGPGDERCQKWLGASKSRLVVSEDVLNAVESVQDLVDCVPAGGHLLFDVQAIELKGAFSLTQSITVGPSARIRSGDSAKVKLRCASSRAVIEIRSKDAVLSNMSIEGCRLNASAVMNVLPGSNVTLQSMNFTDIENKAGPGCISTTKSFLTIDNCYFKSCKGTKGGAIHSTNQSTVVVSGSEFARNYAKKGGAIDATDSNVTITDTVFDSNKAVSRGGAVYHQGDEAFNRLSIQRSNFVNNSAPANDGGALHLVEVREVLILHSNFTENSANISGGAVYAWGYEDDFHFHVQNSRFILNKAHSTDSLGGAVAVEGPKMTLDIGENVLFGYNQAGSGGAVQATNGSTVLLEHAPRFLYNGASLSGGAIQAENISTLRVTGGTFSENLATSTLTNTSTIDAMGGAFAAFHCANISFVNSTFTNNSAHLGGAVILSVNEHVEFHDSQFWNNHAEENAGAISCMNVTDFTMQGVDVSGNSAEMFAGGVWFIESNASLIQTNFTQNLAIAGGGISATAENKPATLAMESVMFLNNLALGEIGYGAGADIKGAALTVIVSNNTVFGYNVASVGGGGMSITTGTSLFVSGALFLGNSANFSGGAVDISTQGVAMNVTVLGSVFKENKAGQYGGGMSMSGEPLTSLISGGTDFTGNVADSGAAVSATNDKGLAVRNASSAEYPQGDDAEHLTGGMRVTFEEVVFTDNVGEGQGGCLQLRSMFATMIKPVATNNTAWLGGSVHATDTTLLIKGGWFEGNSAGNYGGSMLITRSTAVVADSHFGQNKAGDVGGAIAVFGQSNVAVQNCSYSQNNAVNRGGAIYVEQNVKATFVFQKDEMSHIAIKWCTFTGNTAGTVFLANAQQLVKSLTGQGGAVAVHGPTTNCTIEHTRIQQNSAGSGGGVDWREGHLLSMTDVLFLNNEAVIGGGLKVGMTDITTRGFKVASVRFEGNSAQRGGAMSLLGTDSMFRDMSNMDFADQLRTMHFMDIECSRNTAVEQGGAIEVENLLMVCGNCTIVNNEAGNRERDAVVASRGGGLYIGKNGQVQLVEDWFEGNVADEGGAVYITDGFLDSVQTVFVGNNATGIGGALAVKYGPSTTTQDGLLGRLMACELRRNQAKTGGGMHVIVERDYDATTDCLQLENDKDMAAMQQEGLFDLMYKCNSLSTFQLLMRSRHFMLQSTTVSENTALESGSAIFADNPSLITVCCDPDCEKGGGQLTNETFVTVCPQNGQGNSRVAESAGPSVIGSMVSNVEIIPNRITGHTSGSQLEPVTVILRDSLGQVVPKEDVTLIVRSEVAGIITGNPAAGVLIQAGQSTVSGIVLRAKPGPYKLEFVFSSQLLGVEKLVAEVTVTVSGCKIGEIEHEEGLSCFECKRRSYSFDPSGDCMSCPDNAECNGSTLTPDNGHWHSSSQSVSVYSCIFPDACAYTGRQEVLSEKATLAHEQGQRLIPDDELYPQCAEGYAGALCASCQENYGKVRSLECQKCPGKFASIAVLTAAMLSITGVVAFLLYTVLSEAQKIAQSRSTASCSQQPPLSTRSTGVGDADMARMALLSISTITADLLRSVLSQARKIRPLASKPEHTHRRSSSLVQSHVSDGNRAGSSATEGRDMPEGSTSKGDEATGASCNSRMSQRLKSKRSTELLKILVNFLQVIGTAAIINSQWTESVLNVLYTSDLLVGMSSDVGFLSLECVFHPTTLPRSIKASLLLVLYPFGICALFALFWVVIAFHKRRGWEYLRQRLMVTLLITFYICYIGVTKKLVRMLYCTKVDIADGGVARDTERYLWAEDTSVFCYEGYHGVLVGLLGAPLLLVVSVGYPLGLIVKLWRNKARLNRPDFVMQYGFLYKAYKDDYIFWEALVIARKALIATITVFSEPLGAGQQGVLVLGVLVIALNLHIQFRPYDDSMKNLHLVETWSLSVSIAVFFCGLLFSLGSANAVKNVLLSALIIIAIVAFICLLVQQLISSGFEKLERWLKDKGLEHGNNVDNVKTGLSVALEKVGSGLEKLSNSMQGSKSDPQDAC